MGKMYRARYVNEGALKALEIIKEAAVCYHYCRALPTNSIVDSTQAKHDLRLTEIGLRWCMHHSKLTPEDGIIVGASSAAQLKQNCEDSEKGPLPEDVVSALDEAARVLAAYGDAPPYWR
jgi:aflatoxin B1 aldehyde reductase